MLRVSVVLLMLFPGPSAVAEPAAPPAVLKEDQGYLVLDLLLEQRVSEITFTRPWRRGDDLVIRGPYDKGRHLVLLPVTIGELRLAKVASPSYNLPFLQSYSRRFDRLQFKVLSGRTNYFAQIIVGGIRSSYGFEIHVRNRLAYSHGELMEKYGPVLAQYPIYYAGKVTDHFYDEFLKPKPGGR